MLDWTKIQFDMEAVSHTCDFFSFRERPQTIKQSDSENPRKPILPKNKKIKCPPSKLLREGKNPIKPQQESTRRRHQTIADLSILVNQPTSWRPLKQLLHVQTPNHFRQKVYIPPLEIQEPVQVSRIVPVVTYTHVAPFSKDVCTPTHIRKQTAKECDLFDKQTKRHSKLSNVRSLSSFQMQTVKSIADSTVDNVKLQESEIVMNFFQSRAVSKAAESNLLKMSTLESSILITEPSIRNMSLE